MERFEQKNINLENRPFGLKMGSITNGVVIF